MATTFKELSHGLRHALERSALAHEQAAAMYRRTQGQIPDDPENAPLSQAEALFNVHGFCAVHRDQVRSLVGVLATLEGENAEEKKLINSLLAGLEAQLRKAGA